MHASLFSLLELPDGRWCVARIAATGSSLIAGSFAALGPPDPGAPDDPVGVFDTRDEAERAIDRAAPSSSPLAPFAPWLRGA